MTPLPDGVEIAPEEVERLQAAGAIELIDVREPYEHEQSRIAGARHVEVGRLTAEAGSLARDRPVVFYCRVGGRSRMAADAFARAGYDAHTMTGGLERWDAEGRPLVPAGAGVADH